MSSFRISVAACLAALSTLPASATIIGGNVTMGGGTFVKLAPGFTQSNPDNTVGNDTFQSPNLWGFDEDQNIVLAAPLTVNIVASGPLVLPTGTTVASHYIFFDPTSTLRMKGTVDFDSAVVAILASTATLAASDFLANTGVTYLNPGARGLESGDVVTISGPNQISIDFTASSPGDYIRVLTAFSPAGVPEPGSALLMAGGLAMAALIARKRKA